MAGCTTASRKRSRRLPPPEAVGTFWLVFALAVVLLGLGIAGMAIGVMFRRPCLRGSCGGPAIHGPGGEKISCATCPNRQPAAR